MTNTIKNEANRRFEFVAVFKHMDWDIKTAMENDDIERTNQQFFDMYCRKHTDKYGEIFEFNKRNPKVTL